MGAYWGGQSRASEDARRVLGQGRRHGGRGGAGACAQGTQDGGIVWHQLGCCTFWLAGRGCIASGGRLVRMLSLQWELRQRAQRQASVVPMVVVVMVMAWA